jgi:4-amino-4-deoxy-L-arabinose transferase-like glycosyltransferase
VRPARAIFLSILAAAAFLPFLGRRDIVISHEARVVQTARQMAESGWPWRAAPATVPNVHLVQRADLNGALRLDPDRTTPPLHVNPWLVPVLNDEIRLQKPPLPYWCSAILFKLAGHWSEALARGTPALLGALATLLIYDLARRTLGRRFAVPATLVWVTSYFIPDEYRKVMADPYLAFFALAALWAWIRATRASLLLFYIATALGLLAKGPPLLIHLLIPIVLYHVLYRRRVPGSISLHIIGIAILIAIALPWPLYVLRHIPHATDIWRYESVGELTDNIDNARPFLYYLPQLLQISLPWTPLWLFGLAIAWRRRRTLFPLLWYALTVLFFSFVHLKKNAYLLPVMPAQTLLIALAIDRLRASLRLRRRMGRPKFDDTLAIVCTLLVIALVGFLNFIRTPIENVRSPRTAAAFINLALKSGQSITTLPAKLPPEATLYLPLDITFDPRATTILYLLDDPNGKSPSDLASFQHRLPDINLSAARPVRLPGRRYKLFALTTTPGQPKSLALNTTPPSPPPHRD